MLELDSGGDGTIEFAEFVEFITTPKPLMFSLAGGVPFPLLTKDGVFVNLMMGFSSI